MKGILADILLLSLLSAVSCAPASHLRDVRERGITASLALSDEWDLPEIDDGVPAHRDTLLVQDFDGREVIIMKAIKDESSGEMVAHEVLDAAKVTARFRNVAERHGSVDLRFQILIPSTLQDSDWQLRLMPRLYVMDDSIRLEPVFITGENYRKAQLKGYQQYLKFLHSISADSLHFVNQGQLENFIRRNIPSVYRFKNDSSYVSDEVFESAFGVSEQAALEHYTNRLRVRLNRRKVEKKDETFKRLVKAPIITEGLRLDSVIRLDGGDIAYEYVQNVKVRQGMKKASVTLGGDILREGEVIYNIPGGAPLNFYISSLSSLAEDKVRYKTRIIRRKVEANTSCYIEFGQGCSEIAEDLGRNHSEIGMIRNRLVSLVEDRDFDLDSIVIRASCSPEGTYASNLRLSFRRSDAVSKHFMAFLRQREDSLERSRGVVLSLDESYRADKRSPIRFIPRQDAENWMALDALVEEDGVIGPGEKELYFRYRSTEDPDLREKQIQGLDSYPYIRETLYPRLRTVQFSFHLHRKGMVKDTVHTTEIDSTYLFGVQALKDREYGKALTLLKDYQDYNTAVAYVSMDYNASAMAILEKLPSEPRVNYMMALLHARNGEDRDAVECYLHACHEDRSYVFRGNLDPEIGELIRKYGLDRYNN